MEFTTEQIYALYGMKFEQISTNENICSREMLYKKYGQYDNLFVQLNLKIGSDSYKKYGEILYGSLKYTCEERTQLQKAIETNPIPETFGNVKFLLFTINLKYSDEQITNLDRDGLPICDIGAIVSLPLNLRNAFAEQGAKHITNVIPIKTELTATEGLNFALFLYLKMLEQGTMLPLWAYVELIALIKYLQPKDLSGEFEKLSKKKELQAAIRHKYLQYKKEAEGLSVQENEECRFLQIARCMQRYKILQKELQKSGTELKDLPNNLKIAYFNFLMNFENRYIQTYPPAVWLDFERALHIVIRHMKGMQAIGKFESKTSIRYECKELRKLIAIVVDIASEQIKNEFQENPNKKVFVRKDSRAIEYNGNYYRLDIQRNGRLLTFHPYN